MGWNFLWGGNQEEKKLSVNKSLLNDRDRQTRRDSVEVEAGVRLQTLCQTRCRDSGPRGWGE